MWSYITLLLTSTPFLCAKKYDKPHIILILGDDLGWNDFGLHGSNQISTPNIDALGYNGVIFQKHYVQQACTPSRAALLTGNYPLRFGYQGLPIFPGENRTMPHSINLPKALRHLGYRNSMVGKWHLGAGKATDLPLAHGFHHHYGYWNGFIGYFDHTSETKDRKYIGVDLHEDYKPVTNENGTYFTDYVTRKSIDVINGHPEDEPLFLMINHLAGHTGVVVAPDMSILEVQDERATNKKYSYISDANRRKLAEITEKMDDSIGQVVKALSEKDMLENSIILFFSDNGAPTAGIYNNTGSNWPLRGGKSSIWDGAIRSPTVLYSRKLRNRGRTFKNLVHITDWLPTLYAAAGGNPKDLGNLDGINQWNNIVSDKNANERSELLVNIDHTLQQNAYIGYSGKYKIVKAAPWSYDYLGDDGRYLSYKLDRVINSLTNRAIKKLGTVKEHKFLELREENTMEDCRKAVFVKDCDSKWCLFDIWKDPCETTDISGKHPEIVRELREKLEEYERVSVPQQNKPYDALCDPSRCGGSWFPWLDGVEKCILPK